MFVCVCVCVCVITQLSMASSGGFATEMPPEVAAMLQQRGVGQKLDGR